MLSRLLGGVAVTVATAGVIFAQSTTPPAVLPKARLIDPPYSVQAPTPAREVPPVKAPAATPGKTPATTPADAPSTPASNLLTNGACPAPDCSACCCPPCGPPGRFWVDAGWLYWTTSGQNVPPLVTTAPAGTPRPQAGALGQPGTTVLYPTGKVNDDWRSGFYINFGMWLNCCQTCGIEFNSFWLEPSKESYTAGSDGSTIIMRPFYNTTLGRQDTELVSFPNLLAGSVSVNSSTDVWGANPNMIKNICCGPCGRLDFLAGFYYLNVTDQLTINENLTSLPGQLNVTPGTQFLIEDSFHTTNNFYGLNLGLAYERRFSHWYVGLRGGVALGVVHQTVDINGSTTIIPPGGPATTYAGGLLTQPSNIGHYERDMFGVMPWVGVRFGCQVTTRLRAYVGYDFLYMSNVARAGEQIDPRVNQTQIPPRNTPVTGDLYPQFNWAGSPFIMQGIRVGCEYRF